MGNLIGFIRGLQHVHANNLDRVERESQLWTDRYAATVLIFNRKPFKAVVARVLKLTLNPYFLAFLNVHHDSKYIPPSIYRQVYSYRFGQESLEESV